METLIDTYAKFIRKIKVIELPEIKWRNEI